MTAEEIKKKDSEYIMHTYGRFDIVLDHGKGATLWDADGKEYVDLTSGIGVNSLGHGNEKIVGAITKQAEKLMHASNLYYTEPMEACDGNRHGKDLLRKLRSRGERGRDQGCEKVFLR